MSVHKNCLVCKSDQLKPLNGYYEKHGLLKCRRCGFVFMERIPGKDEMDAHYATYSYSSQAEIPLSTVNSYAKLLDEFEKYRKHNRILDVGCGRGWFLREARKRGWEVYGTEYSQAAIDLCTASGITMKQGVLSAEMFGGMEFDVVTSFEVIEHINNPNEELAEFGKLLRHGGLFYCTTPNFNSLMRYYLKDKYNVIEYPEHLSYYTKNTLRMLGKSAGLKPVKFRTTGISITRIRQSLSQQPAGPGLSADEKLREGLSTRWYFGWVKNFVNFFLNLSSTGLTLKAYFVKP